MLSFITRLPDGHNKQSVSIFSTQGFTSGDTAYFIRKLLVKKGYHVLQTMHFTMMTNFHISKFRFVLPRNDDRVIKRHNKPLPKVQKLAATITRNQKIIQGKNLLCFLGGFIQRNLIEYVIAKVSADFEVDGSRCIQCNKCVKICPMKNITKVNGTYHFNKNCMFCMRCYSYCPKNAVLAGKASIDDVKYPRYKGPIPSFDITILTQ